MKNILTFIALAVFSISTFSAQSVPQLINYQAVAHNSAGSPLANQSVSATVIIRSGGATGPIVYQETHSVTTNQFGLFYYQIGSGTIVSGTFSAINWGAQPHFLNTVVNGDDLGTVQLISVPYALASQSTRGINNIPVSTTTPSNGNVLVFNGVSGQWESQAPSGVAGSNSILTSIVETPGANCLNGGYQMQYGTDDNNNSILDAGEIDGSYFICNGLDGVDGVSLNWLGTLATAPGAPNLNDGYYNSSLGQSFIWDGTTWQIIAQDGGGLTPGTTIGEVLTWNGTAWVAQIITETTTTLTNNGDGTFTFTNELGTTTTFDTTATAQTTSTLVNNGNGTFTYTDELGTTTTFDTTGVGDNWGTDVVNVTGANISGDGTVGNPLAVTETTTTLTNNGDGTFTFTNELGTTTTFDTTATAQTTSTLVNNGDGTFTYTDELGTTTTFDTTGVGDNWGTDIVNIAGGILSGDGTAGNPLTLNSIDDADADPTNEIQSLSISGNQINITGGAPALISNTAPTNSGEVLTWDGTNWVSQSLPSGSGWELTGNASTIPGVSAGENFLGTIDASDLLIATSSTPAMWISGTNQNVGIGISNPIGKLHVQTEGSSNFIISHTYSNVADEGGAFFALRARGNEAAPSEVLLGDRLGKLGFLAYNSGLSNYAEGAYIEATAEEDFISTGAGTSLRFHTTPLGLSTSQLAMTIDANQSVGIGTSTPSATLDVVGSFKLENASAAVGYVLTATDALGNAEWQPTAGGGTRLNDSDNDTYIEVDILGDGSENQIHFNLAGTEYFRMNGPTIETLNNSLSVFVGEGAGLNDDLTSNQGVFIGYFAGGANTTGQSNVGVGMLALGSNTTGGANTAVGGNVLNANVTGTGNTAIGFSSQQSSTGDQNTSVGNGSLNSNTTAANNTAVGTFALYNVTTGGKNTAIGMQALNTTSGANNTAIGFDAGTNNTTGFTNLFVGYNANASTGNLTNASAIGPNAIVTQSNSMVFGDGSINVGIGTSNPNERLHVENGNIAITDDNYRIMRIDEGTDLVPLAYGVINNGIVQSNASTGNFTVFKQGIGEYQVNYTGTRPFAGPAEFQVILSTYELGGTITFATYEYVTNQSFIIRVYEIGGGTPSPSDGIVSFTLRVK